MSNDEVEYPDIIYFCKDNKLPNYLKEKCYSVHVMLPNWD